MTKQFTLSLLVLFLSVTFGFSSEKFKEDYRFPANSDAFMKELKDFMAASKNEELIEVFDGFAEEVKKGTYVNQEMELIIKTSNTMLEYKLKANPYFGSYFRSVTNIKSNKCVFLRFVDWHETIGEILNNTESRKFKPFKIFLEFSDNFFKDNVLYETSSGQSWRAFTEDVVIKYDKNGPYVEFEEVDLVCMRKKNRIKIDECSGTFYPVQNKWVGKGGEANWGRFGLGKVRCEFSEFELDVKKGIYTVKNATLFHDEFFRGKGVVGTFQDKVLVENKATEASYPRFESNEKILKIEALGEGVSYQGGFKLQGTKVYGFGDANQKAQVTVKGQGAADAFTAAAELFIIHKGEKITGEQVATVMLVEGDSIYHPSVNMNFNIKDAKLLLTRGDRGSDRFPFYSSYHNFNIDTEKVDWNIKTGELFFNEKKIKLGFSNSKVTFESLGYFDVQDYRKLQNVSDVNPIATLKFLNKKEGTTFIHAETFAKAMNSNFGVENVERLLWDMVSKGYISYDKNTKMIEIREKAFHYADAAMDKVDYDILKIVSDAEKTNAVFDLESKNILANGVKVIEFSSKQKVAAVPTESQIILKQNRNLDIDGNLYAGFGTFEGKDYHFDYEKFQIEMDSIRYFDLFVPTDVVGKDGQREAWSIASTIEHAQGILLIDAPANKSGREDIRTFPSFQSKGNSYVYYDAAETQGGVYSRDSFHFKLDPFSFNHLDDFTEEDVHFDGTMVTGFVFPDFKETLVLQEDESLGFTADSPTEGHDLYQGKGYYKGKINVSNKGILGKGHVDYLWASIESEDITFKPEQMITAAESFELMEDRGDGVPKIKGLDVAIDWRPYLDSMFVKAEKEPFQLFENGTHTVFDLLILTPDGVKGRGEFKWDLGGMNSSLYSFGANSVQSDSADMSINASGVDHLALRTENVNAAFDFDKSTGHVKANVDTVTTVLPYNQYRTSLNEYDWDIKNENINFVSELGKKGYFLSLDPGRDSLSFEGESAFYDLKTNALNVEGVDVLEVADAFVYPSDGKVDIQPGGQVSTLENARIVANRENKYHIFERATVDINGKKDYQASAYYQYPIGSKQQEVYFNNIQGKRFGKGKKEVKEIMTKAQGSVAKGDEFFIDHKTRFEGKIILESKEANLHFKGFAQLYSKSLTTKNWFTVNSKGDKNDLAISYDVPKDENGLPVRTGLFISKEDGKIYPKVMSALRYRKDPPIFEAKGLFKYDKRRDVFAFGDSLKVVSGVKQGALLELNDATGAITMTGPITLGPKLDVMSVTSAGKITTSVDMTVATSVKVVSGVNMTIPEDLLNIIKADLNATSFDASSVVYKPYDVYEAALGNLIPDSKALASSIAELKSGGGLHIAPKYNTYSFLLSNLDLKWSQEYRSFVTKGSKIGLASILGTAYNKRVEGYVEYITSSNQNDRFYLYFVSPGGDFYFFGYKGGILKTVSSSESYNAAVEGLNKKEKFHKMEDGETYEIQLTGAETANLFVNRVQAVQ
ncbi:MAG: hypothetical protein ACI9XB_001914 [Gammaproteobacteria bacterium]|jgi:hypothetical protein